MILYVILLFINNDSHRQFISNDYVFSNIFLTFGNLIFILLENTLKTYGGGQSIKINPKE